MKSIMVLSTAALSCGLAVAPAMAQAVPAQQNPGGKAITCRQFLRLDAAEARAVLYFANGYAAGVEDQIAAGTPDAQAIHSPSGRTRQESAPIGRPAPPAGSVSMANLATMTMDQLRAVCQTSPSATVLSMIPGGNPVSGSGTLSGDNTGTGTSAPTPGSSGPSLGSAAPNPSANTLIRAPGTSGGTSAPTLTPPSATTTTPGAPSAGAAGTGMP
jgi:hypothetical protein